MSFRGDPIRKRNRSSAHHHVRGAALAAVLVFGPMSCVGRTVVDGNAEDEVETGGSHPGSGAARSTGGGPSDGGRPSTDDDDALSDDGFFMPGPTAGGSFGSGGAAGETGAGGQGGANAACELPFEAGPCNATFPVYYHEPQTGACERAIYGGCGGNDNLFATLVECEAACGCADPLNCPISEPCDDGFRFDTVCTECGLGGGCRAEETGCFPVCVDGDKCPNGGICSDGLCRLFCI